MTWRKQNTFLYIVLVCLVPPMVWLHHSVADSLKRLHSGDGSSFIPAAQTLRLVALGYDRLLADFYWLAFVNYVGDEPARLVDHYRLADRYLDVVTGLDPHFVQPYWFCALTVGAEQKRALRANEIIQRGIRANQNNWYLPYIAGINLYLFAHDEIGAAKYYLTASKFPDSPKWLARQAEILAAKLPSTIKEINTWDAIYRTEKTPAIRLKARQRLILLWSQIYSTSVQRQQKQIARLRLEELEDVSSDR